MFLEFPNKSNHIKQTPFFYFLYKKNLKKLIYNEEKYKDM